MITYYIIAGEVVCLLLLFCLRAKHLTIVPTMGLLVIFSLMIVIAWPLFLIGGLTALFKGMLQS